jgi:hypothetical protein
MKQDNPGLQQRIVHHLAVNFISLNNRKIPEMDNELEFLTWLDE